MAEIEFIIMRHVGVLGDAGKGWKRELNVVSWNKREAKYDIRDWDPDHEKMGKGITLTKEDAQALALLLKADLEANGGPVKGAAGAEKN
jgi:hypothetical protein